MKLLALFAAVLLTVNASTDRDQWLTFKQTHNKTYKSLLEEKTRFGIFQNNLRKIEEHNAKYDNGEVSYFMKVTPFADWTPEEFKSMLMRQAKSAPTLNATLAVFPEDLEVPQSIDWTQKGAVLEVKYQGQCGACWAFSATGAMEGQNAIHHNVKTTLSDQQLLDCSQSYGNGNCYEGGEMVNAFRYVKDHGIMSSSSYPYMARLLNCKYNAGKVVLKIKGYKEVSKSEAELEKAVGSIGPISVGVNADPLQHYGGGIFDGNGCSHEVDHAVLAVGYGPNFWKLKNSWGSWWGESGFMRLKKGSNACMVSNRASYPLL